jgi:hypothetical protein
MNRQIVVWSGFNRALFGPLQKEGETHPVLTPEWINRRFNLWKKYTWKSILNQNFGGWIYCILLHQETRRLTDRLFGKISDKRLRLLYYETQQEQKEMEKIARGNDEIVTVRCDSDDMYHPMALHDLNLALNRDRNKNWFQWIQGYGYQYPRGSGVGRLCIYKPKHKSGPFFAHRYKSIKEWLGKGTIHEGQHKQVRNNDPVQMQPNRILVGIHDNSSTRLRMSCFRKDVREPQKTHILNQWKII